MAFASRANRTAMCLVTSFLILFSCGYMSNRGPAITPTSWIQSLLGPASILLQAEALAPHVKVLRVIHISDFKHNQCERVQGWLVP